MYFPRFFFPSTKWSEISKSKLLFWTKCSSYVKKMFFINIKLTLIGNFNCPTTSVVSKLCKSDFLIFITRTIAASTWYCPSWNTPSFVDWFSSWVSFNCTWLILIRQSLWVKPLLNVNTSSDAISRLLVSLSKICTLPQASDWIVRFNSFSSFQAIKNTFYFQLNQLKYNLNSYRFWLIQEFLCRSLSLCHWKARAQVFDKMRLKILFDLTV